VKAATAVLTRAHEQNDAEGTQRAAFMLLVKLMSAFRIDQRRRIFKRRMCGIYFLINREETRQKRNSLNDISPSTMSAM